MYKVFIVDDEIVVRESLRNNINWETTPFVFSGEAQDGEIALSMVQDIKPDILITDIKMPFMDGLELSRVVKRTMPWVKVIILSGHDEFDYAKEAISIGIEQYLLKPICSNDLLVALYKVAGRIEQEKADRMNLESLQEQLRSSSALKVEQLLSELLVGGVSTVDALEKSRTIHLDLLAKRYLIMLVEMSVTDGDYSDFLTVRSLVSHICKARNTVLNFMSGVERIVLLLKDDTDNEIEEMAYELAQAIKYDAERNTKCTITIGIGSVVERIGAIPKSYADAQTARRRLGELGHGQIIGINDLDEPSIGGIMLLDKVLIADKLKYGSRKDAPGIIDQYLSTLGDGSVKSLLLSYYALMDLLIASAKLISELNGNVAQVLPEVSSPEKLVSHISTPEEFKAVSIGILNRVYDFRDSRAELRYGSVINKARAYIDANFNKQDISLHSAATEVNISPNHFSTIFSQETGETFIEYLTRVRINRAKELLRTTAMRSSEISYAVGYNDPHYFSYIFKKHAGITPREFRSQSE